MKVRREKAERLADEELMPLIGDKDPEAFEVFFDRHGGVAFSLAYRIVGEKAAAEDVAQEAFISIWRSGARYDAARGSVRSWMLGIVRNRAIDFLRSKAGRSPSLDFDDDAILERRPASELTEEEAVRRETASEVRGAIGELPGEQSKVIQLAYFGGFSHSEIADILGVPLGTVKGRMRLGLEKIRGELAGGMDERERSRALARRARRLPTRGARARRSGRPRTASGRLRGLPRRAALAGARGAGPSGERRTAPDAR